MTEPLIIMQCPTIHLEAPRELTPEELAPIGSFKGVLNFSIVARAVRITYDAACSWEEVAPPVILLLADVLGVRVHELTLRFAASSASPQGRDTSRILLAARRLRQNPLYPFALTVDDIETGASFLAYNLKEGLQEEGVFTGSPFQVPARNPEDGVKHMAHTADKPGHGVSLSDLGIMPYEGVRAGWNPANFSVANTRGGRRRFVTWLLERGEELDDVVAMKSAAQIVGRHLDEFVKVEAITEGPDSATKLVARILI